ncbi:hypothetical protein [Burkholderia vietnamiensis]|uniref:hypothetical protein n=1 Tax=Burkholderia vietnamiensis TaxID=60552 RepID=UPI001CF1F689|nr:hypothetical protein [Burkholderia vietnamiensis]MCA8448844.1 hypothetical protein [Burkholderia vietnamiensis]
MRKVRVPSFRIAPKTDGDVWMMWMLFASLLRAFGAFPHGTVAMGVGAVCFARWVWLSLRTRTCPSWVPVDKGVSDAEVFAIAQVVSMLVMIATGDLPGAAFAMLVACVCGLRAWSWMTERANDKPSRLVPA